MGTFDISRINFNAAKHYTSVRMQQGRVLTDDDWNENERIEDEDERRSRVHIIGPFGSPDNGFKIAPIPGNPSLIDGGKINFLIKAGTLYLGGLRLELEADEKYREQKDWIKQPSTLDPAPALTAGGQYDLVYLEAWQQPVSAVEDSSLFEIALGGPDTTTRTKNMRRVRIASGIGSCNCLEAWQRWLKKWEGDKLGTLHKSYERQPDTRLTVSFIDAGLPEDLCAPSAAGGYLGAENQAIRVQLVDSTHFVWGFDNASPYYRIALTEGRDKFKMLTDPKDQYHWPTANLVVEILPWSAVLPNGEIVAEEMGHLTKVSASYDPDYGTFSILDPLPISELYDDEYLYLRVWNRGGDLASQPAIVITPGAIPLGTTGLAITFSGNDRVPNDYWVIAARPASPNRVVPWELETGMAPHGVKRFFAPLALIHWTYTPGAAVTGEVISDCRKKFHPLTEQECCCTYTVGDGKRSHGDFDSIQEAVDNLPSNGGKICVLPGEHFANVNIIRRRQIRIMGCGDQSIVMPLPNANGAASPVFFISNSQKIQIDQLTIVTFQGIAIDVQDAETDRMFTERITINENRILAGIHAIRVRLRDNRHANADISIRYNLLAVLDTEIGREVIYSIADGVLIERNRVIVVPARGDDPDDPRDPDDPNDGDPFDPCARFRGVLSEGFTLSIAFQIYRLILYANIYKPTGVARLGYVAVGGIRIGNTSERVHIKANEIIGGRGNGITLGHADEGKYVMVENGARNYLYGTLYEILIEENTIQQMGLSGISTQLNTEQEQIERAIYVSVEDITIYRNHIRLCARQLPEADPKGDQKKFWAFGGVVLGNCENGKIQENRIEENGRRPELAICGVLIGQGQHLDISNNTILENGAKDESAETAIRAGNRGGIVVLMAFKAADMKMMLSVPTPSFDGVPAIKVHDNVVSQPNGFALRLHAFGPVSVVSNQFTSQGRDRTNSLSMLASAVYIINLGISKDVMVMAFSTMANTVPLNKLLENPEFRQMFMALQYLPNGKTMFVGNQTTLDMRAPTNNLSLSSQFIGTLDDLAYNTNQSECAGFLSLDANAIQYDLVLVDVLLFGITLRTNDNRFTEGFTLTFYSLISFGLFNIASGNEATHCMMVLGTKVHNTTNWILMPSAPCEQQSRDYSQAMGVPASPSF